MVVMEAEVVCIIFITTIDYFPFIIIISSSRHGINWSCCYKRVVDTVVVMKIVSPIVAVVVAIVIEW